MEIRSVSPQARVASVRPDLGDRLIDAETAAKMVQDGRQKPTSLVVGSDSSLCCIPQDNQSTALTNVT